MKLTTALAALLISAAPAFAEQNLSLGRPADGFTTGGTYAAFRASDGSIYTRPMPHPPVFHATQVGTYGDQRIMAPQVHSMWDLQTRDRGFTRFGSPTDNGSWRTYSRAIDATNAARRAGYPVSTTKNSAGILTITIRNTDTGKTIQYYRTDHERWGRNYLNDAWSCSDCNGNEGSSSQNNGTNASAGSPK